MLTAWMLFLIPAANPIQSPAPAIDAGEIFAGQPLVRRFTIANAGASPLTITAIETSCGCAAPTMQRRTLAPGEREELTLDVNTLSQPAGPVRWTMRVRGRNGDGEFESALELTARLVREIEIQPAALSLIARPGFEHEIQVIDRRAKPLTMTGASTVTPYLAATIVPATRTVRIRLAESCPEGTTADTLRIATDDPKYPELRVPVTVTCKPAARFTASPSRVHLAAGTSALVQVRGDRSVAIERIDCNHPAVTTRWAVGPGDMATVRIGIDKAKWNGDAVATEIRLIVAGETVRVPVQIRTED